MAPRVKVTLTALNGNLDPAERVLILDIDCPSVPVGRASKTLSKGLQGARGNAWFDSPVMSRDHAELMLDLETDTLAIQDIGSMHGTYLNGTRITVNYPTELNDGDEVVFGAEVRRGIEIFPACAFRINYEFGPYKATNTYSFPETSDLDEVEEDFDFSDEESENEQLSSEDESSIISSEHKASQSIHTIDLTRDESPVYSSFRSIDLTGDTPVEPKDTGIVSDRNIDHNAVENQAENLRNSGELDLDSDSQSSHYSSDDDSDTRSQNIVNEEENGEESLMDGILDCEQDTEEESVMGEILGGDGDDDMDSSVYEYDSDMATASRGPRSLDMEGPSSSKTWGNLTFATASSPTVIKGAERMVAADDEYNDFGLPKAADEAMRVMVEHGLLHSNPGCSLYSTYPNTPYQTTASAPGIINSMLNSPTITDSFSSTSHFTSTSSTGRPTFFNRQPSPSDAAMAKGPEMKESEIPVSYVRSTATLGDGSGKEDFFRAREHNKAKMQEAEKRQEVVSGTGTATASYETSAEMQTTPAPPARVIKACTAKRMRLISTSLPAEAILETEENLKEAIPEISSFVAVEVPSSFSELPVTNSLTDFQVRSPVQTFEQPQIVRSGLRIDEIIDREVVDQHAATLKRKADDISKAVEEDVRIWASTLKPVDTTSSPESHVPTPAQISIVSSSDMSLTSEYRPAKKLRKLMENVAYAALGGVAVGAALFGGLVATAPDFM